MSHVMTDPDKMNERLAGIVGLKLWEYNDRPVYILPEWFPLMKGHGNDGDKRFIHRRWWDPYCDMAQAMMCADKSEHYFAITQTPIGWTVMGAADDKVVVVDNVKIAIIVAITHLRMIAFPCSWWKSWLRDVFHQLLTGESKKVTERNPFSRPAASSGATYVSQMCGPRDRSLRRR